MLQPLDIALMTGDHVRRCKLGTGISAVIEYRHQPSPVRKLSLVHMNRTITLQEGALICLHRQWPSLCKSVRGEQQSSACLLETEQGPLKVNCIAVTTDQPYLRLSRVELDLTSPPTPCIRSFSISIDEKGMKKLEQLLRVNLPLKPEEIAAVIEQQRQDDILGKVLAEALNDESPPPDDSSTTTTIIIKNNHVQGGELHVSMPSLSEEEEEGDDQ